MKLLGVIGSIYALVILCGLSSCDSEVVNDPFWYKKLPACPCQNPDINGVVMEDGWAKDRGDIDKYHKGAAACFRSYPYTATTAGKSSQQCCYDHQGQLILQGSGAGTPDKVSTVSGEDEQGNSTLRYCGLFGHWSKDVRPWNQSGNGEDNWVIYNESWPPNQGVDCD